MSRSSKYSGSRFTSSSTGSSGDYDGERYFKKVEDLDLTPNESNPPETINALKKRIKELNDYNEELQSNLNKRKEEVEEYKEKISEFREEIQKLKDVLQKLTEQRKNLQDEISKIRNSPSYVQLGEKMKKLDEIKKNIKKETAEFEKNLLERQKAGKLVDDYDLFLIQNERRLQQQLIQRRLNPTK